MAPRDFVRIPKQPPSRSPQRKKRKHIRVNGDMGVRLRQSDGTRVASERIHNVSLGGIFVEMAQPLPFGSEVDVQLTLPQTSWPLRCTGFVVRASMSSGHNDAERPGVGMRLMGVGLREMRLLAEFVEARLKT